MRFLEGTLKPRGVFQQRSVSVSANLQMDVGSTKIEWSTNGALFVPHGVPEAGSAEAKAFAQVWMQSP